MGYEAIGVIDATLPTVGVFAKGTEADTPRGSMKMSDDPMRSEAEAVSFRGLFCFACNIVLVKK